MCELAHKMLIAHHPSNALAGKMDRGLHGSHGLSAKGMKNEFKRPKAFGPKGLQLKFHTFFTLFR